MAKSRATARPTGGKKGAVKERSVEARSHRKPKARPAKDAPSKRGASKKVPSKKVASKKTAAKKVTAARSKRVPTPRTPPRPAAAQGPSVHKIPPRSSGAAALPPARDTLPEATAPAFDLSLARALAAVDAAYAPAPELDWGDTATVAPFEDHMVARWVQRGHALRHLLAEHGAADHEYRADLARGRFVWLDPRGGVSAEAKAEVICSWSRSTSALVMAWADPLVRPSGIPRIDGMPAECDEVDEERAWRVAMHAADARGLEFLYRVPTPHASYFVGLWDLSFLAARPPWRPVAPVALVIRRLADARRALASQAEPALVARERLEGLGGELLEEAEFAYRDTDWVARLERTGRRLQQLARGIPRASYRTIAAGRSASEWLPSELVAELLTAIALLEDEWAAFA